MSQQTINPQDIEIGFAKSTIFRVLKTLKVIQSLFSFIVWNPFINFFLWVVRKTQKIAPKDNVKRFHIYSEDRHKLLWKLISPLLALDRVLGCLFNRYTMYERLLSWRSSIPIAAYSIDYKYIYYVLGKEFEDKPNNYSIKSEMGIGPTKNAGSIKIIGRSTSRNGELVIECIWLTGENAGRKFKIYKYNIADIGDEDSIKCVPSYLYMPNNIIIVALELLIAGGGVVWLFKNAPTILDTIFRYFNGFFS